MAKYLDKVIEEMGNYSEMGMPTGEGAMGMGVPYKSEGGRVKDAYKINSILRNRNHAEQQEDTVDDVEIEPGDEMNDYEDNMNDEDNVEEIKTFFMDNPDPSDQEVMQYAEEHDMDMQEMRKTVYRLIQSLLSSDEENMDDYDKMGNDEGNVSMDMDMGGDDENRMSGHEEREIRMRSGRTLRRRYR